jgi:phosphate transport system substrate-binding protein
VSRTAGPRIAILTGLIALLGGCDAREPATPLRLSADDYPRIDGSTSTQPLGMLVACRLTGTSFAWDSGLFDRTLRLLPTLEPYRPDERLVLPEGPVEEPVMPATLHDALAAANAHSGTHGSYVAILDGDVRLSLVAREPSDDELALAQERGLDLRTVPVARDAFVFLRHRDNPVADLTVEQIRAIFSGGLTSWSELGGPERPIKPYVRNRNSGSQVKMERLVMAGLPMVAAPDLQVTLTMIGPFNAIRLDADGIGYSVHYYERYMAGSREVVTLSVEGVAPSRETIRDGSYRFVTKVYAAHLTDLPADSSEARIRDWMLTPEGQAVVDESGYVRLE